LVGGALPPDFANRNKVGGFGGFFRGAHSFSQQKTQPGCGVGGQGTGVLCRGGQNFWLLVRGWRGTFLFIDCHTPGGGTSFPGGGGGGYFGGRGGGPSVGLGTATKRGFFFFLTGGAGWGGQGGTSTGGGVGVFGPGARLSIVCRGGGGGEPPRRAEWAQTSTPGGRANTWGPTKRACPFGASGAIRGAGGNRGGQGDSPPTQSTASHPARVQTVGRNKTPGGALGGPPARGWPRGPCPREGKGG